MNQTYRCARCTLEITDLSMCEHGTESGEHHNCPRCQKPTYHFEATVEMKQDVYAHGHAFLPTYAVWNCSTCRAKYGRPEVDFFALVIPEDWEDATETKCSFRAHGIAARKTGRLYRTHVSSRPVDEEGPVFRAVLSRLSGFNPRSVAEWHGDDWQALIAAADAELTRLENEYMDEARKFLEASTAIASQKGYKPGWVWFRLKDKYGKELADFLLPKTTPSTPSPSQTQETP